MKMEKINRREALGLLAAGAALLPARGDGAQDSPAIELPREYDLLKPGRPVSCVVIGAGNRGNVYASYQKKFPDQWKVVAVAEPLEYRREALAEAYNVPDDKKFSSWEQVFEQPKFADVAVITTPDNLHYGPAMSALELGYDLLLEKAVAQSWQQCNDILKSAKAEDRIVAVCHVLRYTPYFRMLKHLVDSGRIGKLVSIEHFEPVEHIHMSHSFVRGNWRNSKESNPMILSKSCHDLDILRWIVDKPSQRISSFGSLSLFRPEMAPQGAPARCTDGCPAERECPFSALKIYLERKSRLNHLGMAEHTEENILQALKKGPYGRCVYHCDNDVVDHQVTNIEFEGGITAAFSMEGLTSYGGRRTRIMGTMGDVVGDERLIKLSNFISRENLEIDASELSGLDSGHGGGDYGLVRDLVQAVSRQDASLLSSTLEASMESHLMGFMAEESRLQGQVMPINLSL